MSEWRRVFLEAAALAALLAALAALANSVRADGIDWRRDYFLVGADGGAPPAAASDREAAEQRLREAGLAVVPFEEVVTLVDDPAYAEGAFVLVDARDEDHYRAGHLPGAYRLDPYRVEKTANEVIPACLGAVKVIVYCYGGECTDSELAAKHLIGFGVDASIVAVFAGGFSEWCERGRLVERGERGSGDLSECGR